MCIRGLWECVCVVSIAHWGFMLTYLCLSVEMFAMHVVTVSVCVCVCVCVCGQQGSPTLPDDSSVENTINSLTAS